MNEMQNNSEYNTVTSEQQQLPFKIKLLQDLYIFDIARFIVFKSCITAYHGQVQWQE